MKQVIYNTKDVCSRKITFSLSNEGTIHNLCFEGGCNGNLQAISRLVEGKKASEIVSILQGTTCGTRNTSCADQLAKSLIDAISGL